MKNALQFSREVKAEARKVTWPDFKSTRQMTLAVFVISFIVAVYLYIVDVVLSLGISWVIGV